MSAFDLDQFAPPPVRFKIRGVEYVVDGDPDIDLVARMLRIEEDLENDEKAIAAAFEGRDLILELVKERQADVAELKMSAREILTCFYLLMRGESVAAVVGASLTNPDAQAAPQPPSEDSPVATPGDAKVEGDGAPLVLEQPLRERFSSSDDETAGDLVTGIKA